MLIILSSATAAAGRRDDLVAAAQLVASATRADDGCLTYSFSADLEDADRILGLEVWTDRSALDAHLAHDHTAAFLAAIPALVAGPPEMSVHEVPSGP
jgi:quinol monooxygenase YgiN